jgi:hypothetical protein
VITLPWPRLVIGTILLFVGAAEGYLAWAFENCTMSVADSLTFPAVVTWILNALAWLLLARRVPSKLVLFVSVLPALAAFSYSVTTLQIAYGYFVEAKSACATITGLQHGFDGREPLGILLWLLASTSFWAGFAIVARRAISIRKEREA